MATATAGETTVSDRGGVQVPAAVRERLDIDAGDKLRWTVRDDGTLTVEVVHQREGVFEDFEPADGPEMGGVEAESDFGLE